MLVAFRAHRESMGRARVSPICPDMLFGRDSFLNVYRGESTSNLTRSVWGRVKEPHWPSSALKKLTLSKNSTAFLPSLYSQDCHFAADFHKRLVEPDPKLCSEGAFGPGQDDVDRMGHSDRTKNNMTLSDQIRCGFGCGTKSLFPNLGRVIRIRACEIDNLSSLVIGHDSPVFLKGESPAVLVISML